MKKVSTYSKTLLRRGQGPARQAGTEDSPARTQQREEEQLLFGEIANPRRPRSPTAKEDVACRQKR